MKYLKNFKKKLPTLKKKIALATGQYTCIITVLPFWLYSFLLVLTLSTKTVSFFYNLCHNLKANAKTYWRIFNFNLNTE